MKSVFFTKISIGREIKLFQRIRYKYILSFSGIELAIRCNFIKIEKLEITAIFLNIKVGKVVLDNFVTTICTRILNCCWFYYLPYSFVVWRILNGICHYSYSLFFLFWLQFRLFVFFHWKITASKRKSRNDL